MPDLGIGELLGSIFGGGDLLAGLFGGGAAAGEAAGAAALGDAAALDLAGLGAADIGAGAGAAGLTDLGAALGATGVEAGIGPAAATTGTFADLVGPTALGTAQGFIDPSAAAATGLGFSGPTFGGTIADTLAPSLAAGTGGTFTTGALLPSVADASVFTTGAAPVFDTAGISGLVGGAGGALPTSPISSLLDANAAATGAGQAAAPPNVFSGGTSPVTGVPTSGAPTAVPAGGGVGGAAAPAGVTAPTDVTAALTPGSSIPGAAGPTSVGGAPLAEPSSIDSLLGKLGSGAVKSLTSNPLGIGLGAAGLGYNILSGMKQTANQKALSADAAQATANSNQLLQSGEALQQYLTNGTLPPAFQSQVDQAIKDAKTAAISNAAAQGLSTDPNQNTALATTLAKIDASRPNMQAQVASQLFASGSSLVSAGQGAAGLSGQLYQALVQNDTTQAANTGKAIATLAAALNNKSQGNFGGTTITVGG
jgi:hypothetical protein